MSRMIIVEIPDGFTNGVNVADTLAEQVEKLVRKVNDKRRIEDDLVTVRVGLFKPAETP